MVDAHQYAEEGVEEYPGDNERSPPVYVAREAQAGEKEGDTWEKEAGFLVTEEGENDCS